MKCVRPGMVINNVVLCAPDKHERCLLLSLNEVRTRFGSTFLQTLRKAII